MAPLRCNATTFRHLQVVSSHASRSGRGGFVCHQRRGLASTMAVEEAPNSEHPPQSGQNLVRKLKSKRPEFDLSELTKGLIKIESYNPMHPIYLRDLCPCPRCVDPSTRQKNFQTTDIPSDIEASNIEIQPNEDIRVSWKNDVPGYETDHVSTFPKKMLSQLGRPHFNNFLKRDPWSKKKISKRLQFFDYQSYMTDDETLFRALVELRSHGLLLVRNVPERETAVEAIAGRIGTLRDTFYGRTWDVKSVAKAKNVAYTSKYLGLHMDLLYMADPPGFQLLHCIKNTCEGGLSLFSDALHAVKGLDPLHYARLKTRTIPYYYRNAGEHYRHSHPVISEKNNASVEYINWSPPFQDNFHYGLKNDQAVGFPNFIEACRAFAALVEAPKNVFEYRLQEGECVIFNNRRILHGRKGFDTSTGERWLKGAYVDTSVFMSRLRVLNDEFRDSGSAEALTKTAQYVNES